MHHVILSSANLVLPAAVRHNIDNLDGHLLCALQCMFHNLRKLVHTFWYPSPQLGEAAAARWVQTRLSVPASFWSRRMAPRFCAWRREREGARRR